MTTYLGVCGWPVAHSRSPQMHNAALAAVGLDDWRYLRLPLPPDLFEETVRALPAAGFRGVNVTIPHKQAALALADQASDGRAGDRRREHADLRGRARSTPTTPTPRACWRRSPSTPAGRTALVLGAGGAGRAAAWALRTARSADVAVWNRDAGTGARRWPRELGVRAVSARERADIVVNCTSVGLDDPEDHVQGAPDRGR